MREQNYVNRSDITIDFRVRLVLREAQFTVVD